MLKIFSHFVPSSLVVALIIIVNAACVAQAQEPTSSPAAAWQRYFARGEEFSASLPEQPRMMLIRRPDDTSRETKIGRMYGAFGDGVVYVILSFDNRNHKESLDTFINEIKRHPICGSPDNFERKVTLNGFEGREFSFKSAVMNGRMQFYNAKNHTYVFIVSTEDTSRPGVNQFFTSLSLDGKNNGIEIPDESQYESYFGGTPTSHRADEPNQGTAQEEIFRSAAVDRKAIIVTKPEALYTEEARRNAITGTVILRAVLSSAGRVTQVRVISGLPDGLTERAMIAALNLRFIPAVKNGRYVSQYVEIQYNFNLY